MAVSDIDPAALALFEYTRSRVGERGITDFSPNDPGYPGYVRLWTEIHRSGLIPERTQFDLSEVIALTAWADPDDYPEPERFRRYRRFTSAVGIALVHSGSDSDDVRVANYLARDLLVDLDRTGSGGDHLHLLRRVFRSSRAVLAAAGYENGYPFFTLDMMILAQIDGDWESADGAAAQLIEDESQVRRSDDLGYPVIDKRFLFGWSNYDQLHRDWQALVGELRNPRGDGSTQLVIDALGEGWDRAGARAGG
jgi:hypothetical protein